MGELKPLARKILLSHNAARLKSREKLLIGVKKVICVGGCFFSCNFPGGQTRQVVGAEVHCIFSIYLHISETDGSNNYHNWINIKFNCNALLHYKLSEMVVWFIELYYMNSFASIICKKYFKEFVIQWKQELNMDISRQRS